MILKAYHQLVRLLTFLQGLFLLIIRFYWGWSFFQAGKGKLANIGRTIELFQTLPIPFPAVNAYLVGTVEMAGGLCLFLGLFSRLASIPLTITMVVAYLTAHLDAARTILSDPDKFTSQAPFLFLMTTVMVMLFGPGSWSLDYLLNLFGSRKKS